MSDIFEALLSSEAKKNIRKLPSYIVRKLMTWIAAVERVGLRQVQRVSGYHDEPLVGKRFGQRSIRLNQAYRAIYVTTQENREGRVVEFILVEEVNKHDY